MRQYVILYKRVGMTDFKRLSPHVDANLYSRWEVAQAVRLMQRAEFVEGISVRLEDERFNVVSFEQEAEAPNAFKFIDEDVIMQNEPVDAQALINQAAITVETHSS